jgi:hypothetical protein
MIIKPSHRKEVLWLQFSNHKKENHKKVAYSASQHK